MSKTFTYFERKTFVRYNETHCLAYLNEKIVEKYVPEDAPKGFQPRTAYVYSGTEQDGGTLIECKKVSRNGLINGIIRSIYSQSEEDAIKTHQLILLQNPTCEKAVSYASEWAAFCVERDNAIDTVDRWLSK